MTIDYDPGKPNAAQIGAFANATRRMMRDGADLTTCVRFVKATNRLLAFLAHRGPIWLGAMDRECCGVIAAVFVADGKLSTDEAAAILAREGL